MDAGGDLEATVEALLTLDPASVPDAELEQLVLTVAAAADKLAFAQARIAAHAQGRNFWRADGSRSFAAWLARRRGASVAASGAPARLGRALASMPATAAAGAAGEIRPEHARELAACRRVDPDAFAEAEATLVGHARTLRFDDFVRVCAAWRSAADPDGSERAAEARRARRHFVTHRRADGTLSILSGELDPVSAEIFCNEFDRIERELFEADWAEAKAIHGDDVCASKLRRSNRDRRVDALVEMAIRSATAPADGKRPRPLVSVYVDYETVTGRLCELASGAPITPGQLLPLITEADIERVVFGPGNRVIELGVRDRLFRGGLRRSIQLRDRHCQWPGCDVPADRCEIDHIVPYADGGLTVQENGRAYCRRHNLLRNSMEPPDGDPRLDLLDDGDAGADFDVEPLDSLGDHGDELDRELDVTLTAELIRQRVRDLVATAGAGAPP
jgi:hypothetical protein